jgi:hypothetical protein
MGIQAVFWPSTKIVAPFREGGGAQSVQPVVEVLLPTMVGIHYSQAGEALARRLLEDCFDRFVRFCHVSQSRVCHGKGFKAEIARLLRSDCL